MEDVVTIEVIAAFTIGMVVGGAFTLAAVLYYSEGPVLTFDDSL